MEKLIDCKEKLLWHGCVFRFPAQYPYEEYVDFMLTICASFLNDDNLYLVVTTGYNAGCIVRQLPPECRGKYRGKNAIAVSTKWLIENWNKWVYQDCKVEDVYVITEHYELECSHDKSINTTCHLKVK